MNMIKKIFLYIAIEIIFLILAVLSWSLHPGNAVPGRESVIAKYLWSIFLFPMCLVFPQVENTDFIWLAIFLNTLFWSGLIFYIFVRVRESRHGSWAKQPTDQ